MKFAISTLFAVAVASVQAQDEFAVANFVYLQPKATNLKPPVVITPAIIGGTSATQDQFPFMVAILQDGRSFCGGTLISKSTVLTAAHCAKNVKSFALYLGSLDWRNTTTRITVTTSSRVVHAQYNSRTLDNDIAVIKMASNLQDTYFNQGRVALVRIPKLSEASLTFANLAATAVGWGKINDTGSVSSTLNYVTNLVVLPNAVCDDYFNIASSVVCSYGNGTKNICSGDSGGPLMITETDGNLTQIGITSFGAASTCVTYPSGFTRVTSFFSWLQTNAPEISIRA